MKPAKELLRRDAKRDIAAEVLQSIRDIKAGRGRRVPVKIMSVTHVTPADGNVFADLGFSAAEAGTLHVRSQLLSAVTDIYRRRMLTLAAGAKLFGISQPRLNLALKGRIGEFSIDALVSMLSHAGRRVDVSIRPVRKAA